MGVLQHGDGTPCEGRGKVWGYYNMETGHRVKAEARCGGNTTCKRDTVWREK